MICNRCEFYQPPGCYSLDGCKDQSPHFPAITLADCAQFIEADNLTELEEIELKIKYQKQIYVDAERSLSDLTRDEAIQWCIDNKVDFTKPKFPPPEGWAWFDTGVPAQGLTAIFTNNNVDEDDSDIESFDILLAVAAARGIK